MDYKEEIVGYSSCVCGAVTLYHKNGKTYSCARKNLKKFLPGIDLRRLARIGRKQSYCCDHCVNHYGLDLCACGSGEPFDKCDGGFEDYCGKPMQVFGDYERMVAKDAWCVGG